MPIGAVNAKARVQSLEDASCDPTNEVMVDGQRDVIDESLVGNYEA
jgi:hypothetical protein